MEVGGIAFEWLELALVVGTSLISIGIGAYLWTRKYSKKSILPSQTKETPLLQKESSEREASKERLISLEEALQNTRNHFWGRIRGVFKEGAELSQELEDLEEVLYTSDLGPQTVSKFMQGIQDQSSESWTPQSLKDFLKNEMKQIFQKNVSNLPALQGEKPQGLQVWMVVGVNGAGKTTTIGKLCHQCVSQGHRVMVAAGDTFRAAAREQLQSWAKKSQVLFFSPEGVESPSAVAFDAVKSALEEKVDVLIVDTAGRLHTQSHLMEELKKIKRVIGKVLEGAPHETLLILDSNSGQNALVQAKQFHEALEVSGVILTKMDGTSKGGVALGLASELNLNIKLIGVGEKVEDLRPFQAEEFISSILA